MLFDFQSGLPLHLTYNARNEEDIDEEYILNQLTKGLGANYDAGQRVQGSVKDFQFSAKTGF